MPAGTNWVVTTIAGLAGISGTADGTNTAARFYYPSGIAIDGSGNLFVADTWNRTIRKVMPVGTNWVVTTIAGQARSPGYSDGTNSAAQFEGPEGVAVDDSGSLYVADTSNDMVRKLTPAGTNWVVTTIAGYAFGSGTADGTNSSARFCQPYGVGADGAGNIYVADTYNNMIRKLTPAGTNWVVSTLAGVAGYGNIDSTNSAARFNYPWSVAVDNARNVYVADKNNGVRQVTPVETNWVVSTIARPTGIESVAVDAHSNLFVGGQFSYVVQMLKPTGTNWLLTTIAGKLYYSGSADGTNSTARFSEPRGIGVDGSGNGYVADISANTIRKLTPLGTNWVVSTIAGQPGVSGASDGVGTNATFNGPSGVVADANGTLYVSDQWNYTIRRLTPMGTNWVVTTIAGLPGSYGEADGTNSDARFASPAGLALDGGGNLYVADVGDDRIRKVTQAGTNWVVTTIGGSTSGYGDGTNSDARFDGPNGIAVDNQGNLYVADLFNNTIRKGVALPVFQPPMQSNGAFNLAWSAVPGQTFQVQFKTSLAQLDWLNLGGPVTGTNGSAAVFDGPSSDPERFYRVVLLP
jgi:sugar lactone lactonase YvrE